MVRTIRKVERSSKIAPDKQTYYGAYNILCKSCRLTFSSFSDIFHGNTVATSTPYSGTESSTVKSAYGLMGSYQNLSCRICRLCKLVRGLAESRMELDLLQDTFVLLKMTYSTQTDRDGDVPNVAPLEMYLIEEATALKLPATKVFREDQLNHSIPAKSSFQVAQFVQLMNRSGNTPYFRGEPVNRSLSDNGYIRPTLCKISLFKKWLHKCNRQHSGGCVQRIGPLVSPIRLLNVNTMRLELFEPQSDPRYCALSYVWGSRNYTRLTSGCLQAGYDKRFDGKSRLHPAISDAILLIRQLGEQYLWVDALCILQDCPMDKSTQIEQMGLVYQNSLLTIIAAGSQRDKLGLPGVNGSYSRKELFAIRDGHTLMISKGTDQYPGNWMRESMWSKRAWTLQEGMLSRRRLILADDQAFWSCNSADWKEDSYLEALNAEHPLDHSDLTKIINYKLPRPSYQIRFREIVEMYSSRQASHVVDRLSAFQGILSTIAARQTYVSYFWAMTTDDFESELGWCPDLKDFSDRNPTYQLIEQYPSWSWLACKAPIRFTQFGHYQSLIKCFRFQYDTNGAITRQPMSRHVQYNILESLDVTDPLTPKLIKQYLPKVKIDPAWHIAFHAHVSKRKVRIDQQGQLEIICEIESLSFSCSKCQHKLGDQGSRSSYTINSTAWSVAFNRDVSSYYCAAIGSRSTFDKKKCSEHLVLLVDWRDGVGYRVGQFWVSSCIWNVVASQRQLIVMG